MAMVSCSSLKHVLHTHTDVVELEDDEKPISMEHRSAAVSLSSHLSRAELVKRRLENVKLLSKCYRDLYWALLEDLNSYYRHYLCEYGLTPFKETQFNQSHKSLLTCAFVACKLKPMPLTTFCHSHILSDSSQKLYKPCNYVIKSAQAGPITCGKPILISTVPSLCTVHLQKARKHLSRTLKKTGLNISSTSKMTPKFHIIVAEYIHHIQVKRRKELRGSKSGIVAQQENDG